MPSTRVEGHLKLVTNAFKSLPTSPPFLTGLVDRHLRAFGRQVTYSLARPLNVRSEGILGRTRIPLERGNTEAKAFLNASCTPRVGIARRTQPERLADEVLSPRSWRIALPFLQAECQLNPRS